MFLGGMTIGDDKTWLGEHLLQLVNLIQLIEQFTQMKMKTCLTFLSKRCGQYPCWSKDQIHNCYVMVKQIQSLIQFCHTHVQLRIVRKKTFFNLVLLVVVFAPGRIFVSLYSLFIQLREVLKFLKNYFIFRYKDYNKA